MRFSVIATLSVLGAVVRPALQQPDPVVAHVEPVATLPFTASDVAGGVRSPSVTLAAAPVNVAWMSNGLHLAMLLPEAGAARTHLVDVDLGIRP